MLYFRIAVALTTAVVFFSLGNAYIIDDACDGAQHDRIQRCIREVVHLLTRSVHSLDSLVLDGNPAIRILLRFMVGEETRTDDFLDLRSKIFPKSSFHKNTQGIGLILLKTYIIV